MWCGHRSDITTLHHQADVRALWRAARLKQPKRLEQSMVSRQLFQCTRANSSSNSSGSGNWTAQSWRPMALDGYPAPVLRTDRRTTMLAR